MNTKLTLSYNNKDLLIKSPLTYENLQNDFLDNFVEDEDINKQFIFYILDENNEKIVITQNNFLKVILELNSLEENERKIFVITEEQNPFVDNENNSFFGDIGDGGLQRNQNLTEEMKKISQKLNTIINNNKNIINDSVDDSSKDEINIDEDINLSFDTSVINIYNDNIIDKCFYEINMEINKNGKKNEFIKNENIKQNILKIKEEFNIKEEEIKQKDEKINDLYEIIKKIQKNNTNLENELKNKIKENNQKEKKIKEITELKEKEIKEIKEKNENNVLNKRIKKLEEDNNKLNDKMKSITFINQKKK
jgi:hypothetical protein